MMRTILVLSITVLFCTGCASAGSKDLDATAMLVEGTYTALTKEEFIQRFGEPLATKDVEKYTFLGYRRRDTMMNAWSLVPFVGLVAGGVHEEFTTCIARVSKETNLVEDVDCTTESNFQSNAETMVGDMITKTEHDDILYSPRK